MRVMDERLLPKDPIELFKDWYEDARSCRGIIDHHAISLSTIGEDGYPDSRMVLLKGFDQKGFDFYTNSLSRKGKGIAVNPRAAITIFWDPLRRQIRVLGDVAPLPVAESDAYFASRPRLSQIGAWASTQSAVLKDRATFEKDIDRVQAKYEGKEIPRPPHWFGYRIKPKRIEFWQEGMNRLHDRFEYTREDSGKEWRVVRLYP